ncbi:MAG: dihydropteroate synthase [Candidatus Lambdaproteobacteria bacterium]|nr:dihydropteroate synthase [Candidatus Lambdaproteobacteria bacterium]
MSDAHAPRRPSADPADTGDSLLPAPPWMLGPHRWDFRVPLIMGVLNATPDSFSDGGEFLRLPQALDRALTLAQEGADVIDLGGASSHPRAAPVSAAQELERIAPVVERLVREVALPLSIDTQRAEVAQACLALGAHLINDVSGRADARMIAVAARQGAPLVITYNNYTVPPPANAAELVPHMRAFFAERIAAAEAGGALRLLLDPGYGFGKTVQGSLGVLRELPALRPLRRPLLVCTSRKGSLGRITGEADPKRRLGASIATSLFAVTRGAALVRVHDVGQFRQALRAWRAATGEDEV